MKPIRIEDIVKAVSGKLAWGQGDAEVWQVVTDSREAKEGALFVPIIGERVDAHRFIPDVLAQGAACVFSSDTSVQGETGACIFVEDTLLALQKLAAWYRSLFTMPVIAVTGSVGKTTTKEMIGAVMETEYHTLKTFKNLNSQIGVPLMMFHLNDDTQIAVIEMGISMPGEMDRLVEIVRPECAVMTNIGVSHIGNLGSRERICEEKGKIITGFSGKGSLFVCGNGDLKELSRQHIPYSKCKGTCETFYYGTESGCLYYGDGIQVTENGQSFMFHSPQHEERVELSVMGTHNINNAIVALALAEKYRVPFSAAKQALKRYHSLDMRGVVHDVRNIHVIDDSYNASPDSINSNIRALFDYPGSGGRIAVLGDVLELGEQSRALHEGIGRYIVSESEKGRCLSCLVTMGSEAAFIGEYVRAHTDIPVQICTDHEQAADAVKKNLHEGDWILVKGSRGMKMDKVVEQLIKE